MSERERERERERGRESATVSVAPAGERESERCATLASRERHGACSCRITDDVVRFTDFPYYR